MPKPVASAVESRGYFWWHEKSNEEYRFAPASAVPGLLMIEEDGQVTLRLDGSLLQPEYSRGLPFFPDQVKLNDRSLVGTVTEQREGSVHLSGVSLRDYHKQSDGRITMEEYRATSCLVGFSATAPAPDPLLLSQQSISLRGLEEWRCRHAIKVAMTSAEDLEIAQEVNYSLERNVYEIGHGTLTMRSDVHCSPMFALGGSRNVSFNQEDWLDYVPPGPATPTEMAAQFLLIEEFLSLLTGSLFGLEWPLVTSGEEGKETSYTLYFQRKVTQSTPPEMMNLWTIFPQVREQFGTMFSAWIRKRKEFGPGFYLYLGTLGSSTMYVEHRFASLIWGIESLHRKQQPQEDMPPKDVKLIEELLTFAKKTGNARAYKRIKGKLLRVSEPSLKSRIFDVFSIPSLGMSVEMLRAFAKRCADRRNEISHYGGSKHGEDYQAFLLDLVRLSDAVSYLYHAALLNEIGMDKATLHACFYANPLNHKIKRVLSEVGIPIEQRTPEPSPKLAPGKESGGSSLVAKEE